MQECSRFSTSSPAFIVCRLFDDDHSDWDELIAHCHFDLQFSNNEWCWASFLLSVSHLYVFFGEMSTQVFFPFFNWVVFLVLLFPGGSEDKASACKAGDPGSIPGLGRSPGEGNGNPLQYSCLENPIVHWVAKNWTWLSNFTFTFWYWVVWAACIFWKLILCQLFHLLLFSPIMRVVFSPCL